MSRTSEKREEIIRDGCDAAAYGAAGGIVLGVSSYALQRTILARDCDITGDNQIDAIPAVCTSTNAAEAQKMLDQGDSLLIGTGGMLVAGMAAFLALRSRIKTKRI